MTSSETKFNMLANRSTRNIVSWGWHVTINWYDCSRQKKTGDTSEKCTNNHTSGINDWRKSINVHTDVLQLGLIHTDL